MREPWRPGLEQQVSNAVLRIRVEDPLNSDSSASPEMPGSVVDDVWWEINRDLHGIDVSVTSFASSISCDYTSIVLKDGRWELPGKGKELVTGLNPVYIAAIITTQGGLCMLRCGRALYFSNTQIHNSSEQEWDRYVGVRQYHARTASSRLRVPTFPLAQLLDRCLDTPVSYELRS
ncbi:hypothetical protein V8E36_003501 [Tilletia maclaganii]